MRKLIIRDHRGHTELDLDTEEAIRELERGMNNGMLAVATTATEPDGVQVQGPTDPLLRKAEEVRLMHPLRGG